MSALPVRVLLADDHPVVLEGLAAILASEAGIEVVATATRGSEAIELYARESPDVTLVDLRLPDRDGVAVIAALRALDRRARVMVLSSFDTAEDVYRAFAAGAAGYLLKEAPADELIRAVYAVAAGARIIPPAIADRLADRLLESELTPRELEVLDAVARGAGNRKIADRLGISEGTVKGHVSNILSKLGVESRTQAAAEAISRGLVRLDHRSDR